MHLYLLQVQGFGPCTNHSKSKPFPTTDLIFVIQVKLLHNYWMLIDSLRDMLHDGFHYKGSWYSTWNIKLR